MNCPLLPLRPAPEEELGLVVVDALDPLEVVNDPFHEPRQPVYVTGCPAGLLYVCEVA